MHELDPRRRPALRVLHRRGAARLSCTHGELIALTEVPPEIPGCEDCLRTGGRWLHLRMCTTCGHIGCCDSSPNRHARGHWAKTTHPVARSAEAGESWFWCYADDRPVQPARG